jgi:hypothetical protein
MKSLARPLRGLASRFSPKIQAVLNSGKAKSGLFCLEENQKIRYHNLTVRL